MSRNTFVGYDGCNFLFSSIVAFGGGAKAGRAFLCQSLLSENQYYIRFHFANPYTAQEATVIVFELRSCDRSLQCQKLC